MYPNSIRSTDGNEVRILQLRVGASSQMLQKIIVFIKKRFYIARFGLRPISQGIISLALRTCLQDWQVVLSIIGLFIANLAMVAIQVFAALGGTSVPHSTLQITDITGVRPLAIL